MLFQLIIARDGYARSGGFCYPRWALCPSLDGRTPARRYSNGGPVAIVRPVAGKAAPAWQDRAVGFVRFCGGLPLSELEAVALWYQSHRTGAFPYLNGCEAAK